MHWTMAMNDRTTGWLTPALHAQVREFMLHAFVRYDLVCPTYCLMPDHLHLLWLGVAPKSNQRLAAAFFRKQVNELLQPHKLQKQAYDHVLRESERERGAFQSTAFYILENPVRAGLVAHAQDYAYSGNVVPGYPSLDVWDNDYWDKFWKLYEVLRKRNP
ncbi:MAG: hypothetical protein A2X46_09130 [Lentisphaerae bacterium GWF2_57_35]|nr:MAG: hypothetical protein A2X46_09130 [Lentisphaerae bacterium GWF2_57_35]